MIWMAGAFGPFLIGMAVMLWWLILNRASWQERGLGLLGLIVIIVIVELIVDPSMRGPLLIVMTIPMAIAAFALGLIALGSHLTDAQNVEGLLLALVVAGVSVVLKTDGVWGNFAFGFDWRWSKSTEEKLLEDLKSVSSETKLAAISAADLEPVTWPVFRGISQDGVQRGTAFSADWQSHPPKELWRTPVGPAWSSFVAAGNYLFTQEQRGDFESVVCYDANTGKQVWEQSIKSRFFEALGGLGPRATPTIADGHIYAFGAEGWLVKIQAATGDLVWKTDVRQASERDVLPMWGFSSSPLVEEGLVIVHAGGQGNKGVLAFDVGQGELHWSAPAGENSYASVQVVNLLGKKYLGLLSDTVPIFSSLRRAKLSLITRGNTWATVHCSLKSLMGTKSSFQPAWELEPV